MGLDRVVQPCFPCIIKEDMNKEFSYVVIDYFQCGGGGWGFVRFLIGIWSYLIAHINGGIRKVLTTLNI